MRHKARDNLEKKVKGSKKIIGFRPFKDQDGRYVPYCDYQWHQGFIKYPSKCERINCIHYYRINLR